MIRLIAKGKVYAQRGTTYLNIIAQAMVLHLFLASYGITSWLLFMGILMAAAATLLALMAIEDRLGVFEAETELNWSRAPQMNRIIKALDESEDRAESL